MKIISLDLEMNQPSGKIIQIGYVISNPKNRKIVAKRSLLVNPGEDLNSEISSLTGISAESLESGLSLEAAYNILARDMTDNSVTKAALTWGTDNLYLQKAIGIPWGTFCLSQRSIDVKSLFQSWTMTSTDTSMHAGLGSALGKLGSHFVGTAHNAVDDALNTLRVFHILCDKWRLADCVTDKCTELFEDIKG